MICNSYNYIYLIFKADHGTSFKKLHKSKSNLAAYKVLRKTSVVLIEQLNLFEMTVHLHHIDGLTPLELEKLTHSLTTELERKQYLVTTVIPSRGYYKGMMLLRRVLKKSKQFDLYKSLKLAYDEAVNPVYGEKLKLLQKPEVEHETRSVSSSAMFIGSHYLYKNSEGEDKRPTSISSCSSDDSGDDILLASPEEQLSMSSYDVDIEVPRFVVTSSPHRQRSGHISYQLRPYRVPPRQAESVTNNMPDNSGASDHDKVSVIAVSVKLLLRVIY